MHPVIFSFGGITIYSFGLMMGISFLIGNYLLTKEFKRRKLHADLASNVTLIALIAGVSGSKLLYLMENWKFFVQDPIGMTFSPRRIDILRRFHPGNDLCICLFETKEHQVHHHRRFGRTGIDPGVRTCTHRMPSCR